MRTITPWLTATGAQHGYTCHPLHTQDSSCLCQNANHFLSCRASAPPRPPLHGKGAGVSRDRQAQVITRAAQTLPSCGILHLPQVTKAQGTAHRTFSAHACTTHRPSAEPSRRTPATHQIRCAFNLCTGCLSQQKVLKYTTLYFRAPQGIMPAIQGNYTPAHPKENVDVRGSAHASMRPAIVGVGPLHSRCASPAGPHSRQFCTRCISFSVLVEFPQLGGVSIASLDPFS